jgi:hypothetical protein
MRHDAPDILMGMGYTLDRDFIARRDGGETVIEWLAQSAQPTEAEIDAAALGAYKASYRQRVRAEAKRRIFAQYTEEELIALALGAYTTASAVEAQTWIGAMKAKVATVVGQINAATTVEQLDAGWAALTWPDAPSGALVHDEQSFAARLADALALRQAVAQADTDLTALMATSGALTTSQLSTYLRRTAAILRGVVRHVSRMT